MTKDGLRDAPVSRRFAQVCGGLSCGISLLAATGWASGSLGIARWGSNYVPMAPSSALALAVLGVGLFVRSRWPASSRARRFTAYAAAFSSGLALLIFLPWLGGSNAEYDRLLVNLSGSFAGMPTGRMSPVTAIAVFLAALALLASVAASMARRTAPPLMASLATGVTAIGSVVLLGYAYRMPLLYGASIIPVALPTALALLLLGLGLLAAGDRRAWPTRIMLGPSIRARLMRAFLPVTLAAIVCENWLEVAFLTEYSANPVLWSSLTALASVGLIGGTVAIIARSIGGAMERAEEALRESEQRYRSLFDNMLDGFAYCKMLFDEQGHPDDFVYLAVNKAFDRLTGLKDVVGRRVSAVIPGIKELSPELFEIYGRVASTGTPEEFEIDFKPLHLWFSVSVYSVDPGHFVAVFDDITERKRAEEAVRSSEAKYRQLHESMRDAFVSVAMDGRIQECNKAYLDMLGYTWEELHTLTCRDLTPAKWHVREAEIVATQVLPRGYSDVYEKEYRRKDGTVFLIELRTILLHDDTGQPCGMWGIVRDISERRRAEETLKTSERAKSELLEKLNDAQRIAIIGSWEWNLKTDRVWWSDETYRIFGVTPQDFVPSFEANGRFIHPDDLATYNKSFEHSLQTGESLDIDLRLVVGDGRLKFCHGKGTVVYDESCEPTRFVGTIMDVTEHHRAEEALRQSEEKYRGLIDICPDAVLVSDMTGKTQFVSQQTWRLLGVSEQEELVGRNTFDYLIEADRPRLAANFAELIQVGQREHTEYTVLRPDGTTVPVELSSALIRDAQGQPRGAMATIRDVSERKRAEEALRKSEAMLSCILNSLPLSIFWKDRESVYLGCNETFASGTRLRPEDVRGKNRLRSALVARGLGSVSRGRPRGDGVGTGKRSTSLNSSTGPTGLVFGWIPRSCRSWMPKGMSTASWGSMTTSPNGSEWKTNSARPRTPPKRPTAPRASSWPT